MKQTLLGFIGNLCADPMLRCTIAADTQSLLSTVYSHFSMEANKSPLTPLVLETLSRYLAVLINVSLEPPAQSFLLTLSAIPLVEKLLMSVKEEEVIGRLVSLVSKLGR